MLTKLFVGLTFFEDNHFAKKIQSYRGRYDEKLLTNPTVFMPLVPPFEIPTTELASLQDEIVEEMEAFFPGDQDSLSLGFTGIDVYTRARKMTLYLHPQELTDLSHCAEALTQICRDHVELREHRPSEKDKGFLTIGRFTDPVALTDAMTVAQREFQDCTALPVKGVCLFQKHNGVWFQQADLYRFDQADESSMYASGKP
jgi:hypothetical protein